MRIAINARVLTERAGGPARYTKNIIHELSKLDRSNKYLLIVNRPYTFDFKLPENFRIVVLASKIRLVYEYILYPLYSWFNKIDLHIFPKNTFSPMVRGLKIPVYHDIIYYEKDIPFREFKFFDNLHHTVMIRVAGMFSKVDLTVSDFTAERMRKLLKISDRKIRIVKEAVEDDFRVISDKKILNTIIKKYELRQPFFFYSGSLSPRKNMVRVLQAFNNVKNEIPHILYFTGGDSWRDSAVFDYIRDNGLEGRVKKLGFLSESELVAFYNLADCYIYPSLYEGFGLPILEAQACGTPVITGNISSCPEIAGDAALLVNPYDTAEISTAMIKIARDKKLRTRLIANGLKNIKKYSWKKAASQILDIINE